MAVTESKAALELMPLIKECFRFKHAAGADAQKGSNCRLNNPPPLICPTAESQCPLVSFSNIQATWFAEDNCFQRSSVKVPQTLWTGNRARCNQGEAELMRADWGPVPCWWMSWMRVLGNMRGHVSSDRKDVLWREMSRWVLCKLGSAAGNFSFNHLFSLFIYSLLVNLQRYKLFWIPALLRWDGYCVQKMRI